MRTRRSRNNYHHGPGAHGLQGTACSSVGLSWAAWSCWSASCPPPALSPVLSGPLLSRCSPLSPSCAAVVLWQQWGPVGAAGAAVL